MRFFREKVLYLHDFVKLWISKSFKERNTMFQLLFFVLCFMSFLPPQIRHPFEYWAALPELVYWAQKKIIITKWSEMAQGEGPEPV